MSQKVKVKIREVWADNLEEELAIIRDLVDDYNFVAMDTEFPGVVARPVGTFKNAADFHYQTLKCNCDILKMIQLGLTFSDEDGQLPPHCCTWQFNFKFNLNEDMFAQESIDLLQKAGIDFKRHEQQGIDIQLFGELFMISGIVLNPEIRWVSFHSGFDFAYLMRILTAKLLPVDESEFFELIRIYFPAIYDIKYMMQFVDLGHTQLRGGLQKVAETLEVERVGPMHQAGSDSLLTLTTFFKLRSLSKLDREFKDVANILYGLGPGCIPPPQTAVTVPATLPAASGTTTTTPGSTPSGTTTPNSTSNQHSTSNHSSYSATNDKDSRRKPYNSTYSSEAAAD
eukprot:TRINITY_DN7831_c0_g1::TRINITY_DN7831_c0_g1_i1::g.23696::m.23696 TRINITY_DN7831_c0_g1::TRINITY_DN7831_c0_g1_i1::g.23696  ORF type:complete len:341 (-),score=41.08,sp/Q60809/CNOT7_MOUSE/57.53/1e-106,CAF1/PF04857.15/1.6e-64,Sporozoite_P67/PF05642.6/1.1 TRINITY_DN7831_c0_g1_i1:117-1139(-)